MLDSKFVDREHAPANGKYQHYNHPFNVPHLMSMATDMAPYWAARARHRFPQTALLPPETHRQHLPAENTHAGATIAAREESVPTSEMMHR